MTTKIKTPLLAITIVLAGCAGPTDSESDNNPVIHLLDTSSNDIPVIEVTPDSSVVISLNEDSNCKDHFETAMSQTKPADVNIVHCSYWTSGHPVWLEHTYSFEIEKNDSFFKDLLDNNAMLKISDNQSNIEEPSEWFLPKEMINYEGLYTEDDFDDFEIFRALKTGDIFIRGSQF